MVELKVHIIRIIKRSWKWLRDNGYGAFPGNILYIRAIDIAAKNCDEDMCDVLKQVIRKLFDIDLLYRLHGEKLLVHNKVLKSVWEVILEVHDASRLPNELLEIQKAVEKMMTLNKAYESYLVMLDVMLDIFWRKRIDINDNFDYIDERNLVRFSRDKQLELVNHLRRNLNRLDSIGICMVFNTSIADFDPFVRVAASIVKERGELGENYATFLAIRFKLAQGKLF